MVKVNLLAVLTAVFLPMNLQAEVITQWNFDGGDLSAMNGVRGSATDISFGSTWSAVNDQLERNTASSPNNNFNRLTTTPANQFGFTFTVSGLAANEVLDIESASFDYAEPGVALNTVRYA